MQIFQLLNALKHRDFTKSLGRTLALGAIASVLLYSTNANAAEQVILKYGNFRGAVSVKELNKFVKTGETTPTLGAYFKAARQDPTDARKALTAAIKADPEFLDNLLSSWAGPILLSQVGDVVHPPSNQADYQGLRSALAVSISQNREVTLLNAIQNYPAATVELEGDRLIPTYKRLSELAKIL